MLRLERPERSERYAGKVCAEALLEETARRIDNSAGPSRAYFNRYSCKNNTVA